MKVAIVGRLEDCILQNYFFNFLKHLLNSIKKLKKEEKKL